ncbi:hypothetical protein [Mediterranea massiliensis]|uniref:hypothetical protein n=1 Tax=Mediterranea massiliensis TaxID=1841865 RepID=UPI0025A485C6|nr:hypothetical protein [Mediterranea massiliensis]MDM8338876.1 hypothetical protein [Mediterranea massiliensis]
MKRTIFLISILTMLNISIGFSNAVAASELMSFLSANQLQKLVNTSEDDRFKNWTEEQYRHYEDSIRKK